MAYSATHDTVRRLDGRRGGSGRGASALPTRRSSAVCGGCADDSGITPRGTAVARRFGCCGTVASSTTTTCAAVMGTPWQSRRCGSGADMRLRIGRTGNAQAECRYAEHGRHERRFDKFHDANSLNSISVGPSTLASPPHQRAYIGIVKQKSGLSASAGRPLFPSSVEPLSA